MLDKDFEKLKNNKKLNWYPFIGKEYLSISIKNRMLVIGESHYLGKEKSTKEEIEKSREKHNDKFFTRRVINENAIQGFGKTKIFQPIHQMIKGNNKNIKNDKFDTYKFWNLVSFYNFIQKPMENIKKRPIHFQDGWSNFFDLIKVIEPSTCLFIGVSSFKHFNKSIGKTIYKIKPFEVSKYKKRNGTFPIIRTIIDDKGKEIDLIFIKHTSVAFKPSIWRTFIDAIFPNLLSWFENVLYENK